MHPRGALLAVLAVTLLVATGSARGQCFTEFRASPGSGPADITAGPDGNLWFTEFDSGRLARILPFAPNTLTEFNLSHADIRPAGIASGPDGNVWFVENTGNQVGRISPASIIEFSIPTPRSAPQDIVAGPDGNLWFTEAIGKIGRITPGSPNTITEFPIPSGQGPRGITVGPDGNIWFAEGFAGGDEFGDRIGRITPGSPNTITEFPIPTAHGSPAGITTGPDGNLWFTEVSEVFGNNIGRITPGEPNTITEFPIPGASPIGHSRPLGIVTGPDGNLWFTENGSPNALGRISPDSPNTITEFSIPSAEITKGPDGNLWFTQIEQSVWRMTIADCDRCVAGKLKAIGKKESGRIACLAKVAKTGDSSGLSTCVAKVESTYTPAFAKAGECGSSATACGDQVDFCMSQVAANLPDVSSTCEASKLTATSKAAASLFNCSAKSALRGKPADPACTILLPGKIQDKLTAAFAKADRSGPCSGDPSVLDLVIDVACHGAIPVTDSAGTVAGFDCF
jgi:streptogramin lyase